MATDKTTVTIDAQIDAPVAKVWALWSNPADIIKWSTPSPDWHTPTAENDLRAGGTFTSRMEARDGSMGFDFGGVYDVVTPYEYIEYTLGDGRKVTINFNTEDEKTHIIQTFDAESQNPVEMQRAGWQAILNNFKQYAETKN